MGKIISIEKVLNSRCSSDFDGPEKNHWGIYKDQRPTRESINCILQCSKVPQYSKGQLLCTRARRLLWFDGKYLSLGFKKMPNPFEKRMLHIESGMQQEAIYLACTALGLGTCIHNIGVNGTKCGDKVITARHLILESLDCYETGKFSTAAPGPEVPFKRGKNLTEPMRDGDMPCLPELQRLALSNNNGSTADEKDISQLLWAAKGRTPHYVMSRPWGLTIPTWDGEQRYTDVYVVSKDGVFRYVNWAHGHPTHDIVKVRKCSHFRKKVNCLSQIEGGSFEIILCRNEKTARALWEVGYMLENMFLQAKSLKVSYKSKVFKHAEVSQMSRMGISEAVAAMIL